MQDNSNGRLNLSIVRAFRRIFHDKNILCYIVDSQYLMGLKLKKSYLFLI
jgi:hypothetical protein